MDVCSAVAATNPVALAIGQVGIAVLLIYALLWIFNRVLNRWMMR